MDAGSYCREVESYLCRKNDGHLIRIVGPAFDLVCGWATRGMPLRVVFGAIDRTFRRYYAKGPRRRPVRIEFCEADVLDVFDEWRRAVGVGSQTGDDRPTTRRGSLATHVERVADCLRAWRQDGDIGADLRQQTQRVLDELTGIHDQARLARGDARRRLIARLGDIERELMTTLRDGSDPGLRDRLRVAAARDLEPYRQRMPSAAFAQALVAATDRLLSEHHKLPRIAFDG